MCTHLPCFLLPERSSESSRRRRRTPGSFRLGKTSKIIQPSHQPAQNPTRGPRAPSGSAPTQPELTVILGSSGSGCGGSGRWEREFSNPILLMEPPAPTLRSSPLRWGPPRRWGAVYKGRGCQTNPSPAPAAPAQTPGTFPGWGGTSCGRGRVQQPLHKR